MKLLRVGQKGREKPAILDKDGKIRDLSSHIHDLNPDTLNFKTISDLQNLITNWYLIFSDAIMFIGKKYVCYLNYGSYWLMACNNMSSISQVTASSQLENAFQRKVFG